MAMSTVISAAYEGGADEGGGSLRCSGEMAGVGGNASRSDMDVGCDISKRSCRSAE